MTTQNTVSQSQVTERRGGFDQRFLFPFETQTLMNHLWFGQNLKDSIAAPLLFVDSETAVTFEPTFDKVKHPRLKIQYEGIFTTSLTFKKTII